MKAKHFIFAITLSAFSFANAADYFELKDKELDQAVKSGKSIELLLKLYKTEELELGELQWLITRAPRGIPPFQYEMARRIKLGELPGSVVGWFAKGYVVRSLDAAECSNRSQNPNDMALRTLYSSLADIALKQPAAYAEALEQAIEWEGKREIKPSSEWICTMGVLPGTERQEARAKQLEEIRAGISRLRAKASFSPAPGP